ncbi:hypothetical protein CMUST_14265 [Corynebacterium mustelae]|uniref:DUF1963 family protein n=1 Tax=Corynebacterium mustelae TaxID=571915 RepID=A0A0G3H192_9CORY|nr:hypothetical protein [Corynebacterium mustelae]AKK07146.1 hypothetical protein CMUST_14265 [Corynebacterium mustelae]
MYEISSLEPFFTPFPEPSDVFAGNDADIARAAEHLLPLLTIDLEAYDPEFAGLKVHMLSPIEPYEGLVGENTEDYHNYYLRENWFGFRLTEDNKYEFLGDWRYFEAENPESALMTGTMRDDFIKHRDELRESYAARKQYFEKYNQLVWVDTIEGIEKAHAEPNVLEYLESWKEPAVEDNWVGLATIPLKEEPCVVTVEEEEMEDTAYYPISEAGNQFYLIAETAGYNYAAHGADSILLFFEPKERLVLFTFDWS